jgi:hypothetical protein
LNKSRNEAWITFTPRLKGAIHPMTDSTAARTATPQTAAQRIVAAMWHLGEPATTKTIAATAGVGYSTATPILRNLLATNQAVKTDGPDGNTLWHLTAIITGFPQQTPTIPNALPAQHEPPQRQTPDAPAVERDPSAAEDASGRTANSEAEPQSGQPTTASDTDKRPDAITEPDSVDPSGNGAADAETADVDAAATPTGEAAPNTKTEPADSHDPAITTRTYRMPTLPRRPKGELRAAVLAVLQNEPERQFKVSDVCKAINAANADTTSNKAGGGAVANALDKLVGSGDAVRLEAKYATYQAADSGNTEPNR